MFPLLQTSGDSKTGGPRPHLEATFHTQTPAAGRQAGNQLHLLSVWEQKQEVCRIQVIQLSELGPQASGSSWPGGFTRTVGPWACHLLTA